MIYDCADAGNHAASTNGFAGQADTRPVDNTSAKGTTVAEVVLPKWGVSMTEATVARWYRQAGEPISEGEALVDVETDKVETTIDSPVSGTVTEIRVAVGETVAVGSVLAVIA